VYVGDALLARRCFCGDGAGVSDNLTELGRLTRVGSGRQTSDADSGMLSATWILGAFLVTTALAGRDGVVDLARRSMRWRVPIRWYLIALFTVPVGATLLSLAIFGSRALASPAGGWPRALAEVAAVFLLQLVLFSLPKRSDSPGSSSTIGKTGITP
jgi:hypothetical protein